MSAAKRADAALYATLDCGGPNVMRARRDVATRLACGKRPRMRDVRVLERAALLAGNSWPPVGPDRRAPRTTLSKIATLGWILFVVGACAYGLVCLVGYLHATGVRP